MSPQAAEHFQEAKLYAADARRDSMVAICIGAAIVAGAATGSDIIDRSPLLNGPAKEAASNIIEGIGVIGAGAIVFAGLGSATRSGVGAAYHRLKAWKIEREEAKQERYGKMFYWPISPNHSHLNGNL